MTDTPTATANGTATPATQAVVVSRLDKLREKYQSFGEAPTARAQAYQAFDAAATYQQDLSRLERISKSPYQSATGQRISTGDLHKEMAEIQMSLAELAEEHGELNTSFSTLIGSKRLYNLTDVMYMAYKSIVQDKNSVRQRKLTAIHRRGDAMELLVDKMAEILNKQYQKAVQGKARAEQMQVENIAHVKKLDHELIANLKKGYGTGADRAAAEAEVGKLEKELLTVESDLAEYERGVQAARSEGNLENVLKLTGEMSKVLDYKHKLLDGRLSAEGVVSEIRRKILDSAEGVQSAKGAIAVSKVNYQAINALIDSYSEMEIKYRHAREHMMPVFKIQARIAAHGMEALKMREVLTRVANASQRLMETNAKLVTHLSAETFELLRTSLYDPVRAQKLEEELQTYYMQLKQAKMDWAEQTTAIHSMGQQNSGFTTQP